jgi:hypothetical protein
MTDEVDTPAPEPIVNRYEFVIIAEAEVIKAADIVTEEEGEGGCRPVGG